MFWLNPNFYISNFLPAQYKFCVMFSQGHFRSVRRKASCCRTEELRSGQCWAVCPCLFLLGSVAVTKGNYYFIYLIVFCMLLSCNVYTLSCRQSQVCDRFALLVFSFTFKIFICGILYCQPHGEITFLLLGMPRWRIYLLATLIYFYFLFVWFTPLLWPTLNIKNVFMCGLYCPHVNIIIQMCIFLVLLSILNVLGVGAKSLVWFNCHHADTC